MTNEDQFSKAIDHLEQELGALRTGRATPALIEHISVAAYGVQTPIKELASISVPEPQSLIVQPWDATILQDIEKAIQQSSLGIQPINDGQLIRLVMPQLTQERRQQLAKVVKQKAEEAKISVRSIREKAMKEIKKDEQSGILSEDQAKNEQKKMQEAVDKATATIADMAERKDKEVTTS